MNKLYVIAIICTMFTVQVMRASECFHITELQAFNIDEGKKTTINHIGCIDKRGIYFDYLMDMEFGVIVETVGYDNYTGQIVVGETNVDSKTK